MFKNIFYPTQQNIFVWLTACYLLLFLCLGKVSPLSILFVYFLETIIIGIFNVFKMYCSIQIGKSKGYRLIFFFIIHYGFFVAIQSIFAFAIFSLSDNSLFKEPFFIFENYSILLNLEDIKYALPAIIFTHLGKFFTDYISNKKYLKFTAKEIMFSPYIRIFIQQFVVILSFFFIVFANAGYVAAILLIVFKLIIDLVLEALKENSKTLDFFSKKLGKKDELASKTKKQLLLFSE